MLTTECASRKGRTKKEASCNTNRPNPAGHERKILEKLQNAEKKAKEWRRRCASNILSLHINIERENKVNWTIVFVLQIQSDGYYWQPTTGVSAGNGRGAAAGCASGREERARLAPEAQFCQTHRPCVGCGGPAEPAPVQRNRYACDVECTF